MAPEVVNRKGHGTTADWWSFGVLMVCGRKEGREGRGRRGKEGGRERREEGRRRKKGKVSLFSLLLKGRREKEGGRTKQNNEWVGESIWRLLHLFCDFSPCAHTFSMRCSRGRYRSRGRTGKLQ